MINNHPQSSSSEDHKSLHEEIEAELAAERAENPTVDRVHVARSSAVPVYRSARRGFLRGVVDWFLRSGELVLTLICSAGIGLLAAMPLNPLVMEMARYFGLIHFFDYHWAKFGLAVGHYSDTAIHWYLVTALAVTVLTFGVVTCGPRQPVRLVEE